MPQRAVVVELGVAEVLKRQMLQAVEGGVYVNLARANLTEKRAQLIRIH